MKVLDIMENASIYAINYQCMLSKPLKAAIKWFLVLFVLPSVLFLVVSVQSGGKQFRRLGDSINIFANEAGDVADRINQAVRGAKETTEKTKETIRENTEKVRESTGKTVEKVKETGSKIKDKAEDVAEKTGEKAEEVKEKASKIKDALVNE